MKKLLTFSLLLALGAGAHADKLQLLSFEDGFPQPTDPPLMGLTISPNGKYVAGVIDMGAGIFIADRETGKIVWEVCGEEGGELRDIDNNGLAIGIMDYTGLEMTTFKGDQGITFSFENAKTEVLAVPSGYRGLIGEGLTNDGKTMIASLSVQAYETKGGYKKEGGAWTALPDVKTEELGYFDGKIREKEAGAKFISADGKVIYGCLGGFAVPTVWIMNDKGEYEMDFFPARYLTGDNSIIGFSAMYGMNLSDNGKYLLMMVSVADENNNPFNAPAVYDTETRELTVYDNPQKVAEGGRGLFPTAIANDGTIIGCIGQPYFGSAGSFIIKSGETEAVTFNEAFPEFKEVLGVADELGYTMPCGISADGNFITGYTYYCEDYMDPNAADYYVTFVIDREQTGAVNNLAADKAEASPEAYFTLDGRRANTPVKGVNIVRMSDGSARKIIVK